MGQSAAGRVRACSSERIRRTCGVLHHDDMARPPLAVVGAAAAAGTALYYLIKSRRNLAGSWYSVAKATGHENGDQYEFRYEGGVYKIYRGGHHKDEDQFKVVGDKIQHVHGPTATLLPSGELHWDIDNGKWLSRKKGVAPAVVRTLARLFVRSPSWPPAHAGWGFEARVLPPLHSQRRHPSHPRPIPKL